MRFCQQEFGEFPQLVGRYCSYLLPKQAGGTPQIIVDKTSRMTGRLRVYANEWIDTCTRYLAIMNVNRNAAYLSVHGAPRVAGAVPAEGPRPAALAHARVVLAAAARAAVHVAHARLAVVARPPAGARASDDGSRAGTFKVFQFNRVTVILGY